MAEPGPPSSHMPSFAQSGLPPAHVLLQPPAGPPDGGGGGRGSEAGVGGEGSEGGSEAAGVGKTLIMRRFHVGSDVQIGVA